MKKKILLALLLAFNLVINKSNAQTTLYSQNFEGSDFDTYQLKNSVGSAVVFATTGIDYIVRANPGSLPLGNPVTGFTGNVIALEDHDGAGFAGTHSIDTNPINIASTSSLVFKFRFAAARGNDGNRYDSGDFLRVQTSIDGGAFQTIINTGGANSNGRYYYDAAGNGITGGGDDVLVAQNSQEITSSIPGTGTSMIVRVIFSSLGSHGELLFDDLLITGVVAANNAPTNITLAPNSINQTVTGVNVTVGTLSTTDADGADSHTYSLVSGAGSTNNGSFNINGSTIRTSSALTAGTYSTRVNTNDGTDNFAKAISVTVVDNIAPRITSIVRQNPTASPTNVDTLTWDVTFDSAVANVNTADFTVSGTTASITSVTNPSGNVYRVTTSGGNLSSLNGTITLGFTGGQNIADASGNALVNLTPTGTNNNTFLLDNTAPLISSITRQSPTTSPTNADVLVWDVTFNGVVINVNTADFNVSGTTASITSVTNPSGNVYRVTTSGGDLAGLNGTVTLGFAGGQNITDAVGNGLTNLTPTSTNNNTFVLDNILTLASTSPTDNSTDAVLNQDIILTFNENISKGTGNILIKRTSDNSTIETIDVTTAAVTVSTTMATINPTSDFDLNTEYYIQIDNTAFKDGLNNNYAGISNTTDLNFTTETNQTNTYSGSGNWSVTSNWSLTRLPIVTDNIQINFGSTVIFDVANVTINNLTINSGTLNMIAGNALTVNGNLTQNGTFNIDSNATANASLIVKGTSSGNVNYLRYLTTNWHLISSPVAGKNINDFAGSVSTNGVNYAIAPYKNNTTRLLRWNYYTTAAGTNNIAAASTFATAKGYTIKKSGFAGTVSFSGTLNINNTGESILLTDGGVDPAGNRWNLIGSPYTAALEGGNSVPANQTNTFLKVNASNLDPSRAGLYLWNGSAPYVAKSVDDDFFIAPGQAFFVHAPNGGGTSASFTEAMQTHQTGNIFLKGTKSYPEIILQIFEGTNISSTKIRYIENKTTGLDVGSDIGTFTGANSNFKIFTHLVSNSEGIDFAIQALPINNFENMVVPVGLTAEAGKEITFSLNATNFASSMKLYLEDRATNTFTQLDELNSNYKITLTEALNGIGRFYLHTTNSSLSIDKNSSLKNVSIYKLNNNTLRIAGLSQENVSIKVFTLLGKQVISNAFKANGIKDILLPKLTTGVYIVQLQTSSGKMNKKIILE